MGFACGTQARRPGMKTPLRLWVTCKVFCA